MSRSKATSGLVNLMERTLKTEVYSVFCCAILNLMVVFLLKNEKKTFWKDSADLTSPHVALTRIASHFFTYLVREIAMIGLCLSSSQWAGVKLCTGLGNVCLQKGTTGLPGCWVFHSVHIFK